MNPIVLPTATTTAYNLPKVEPVSPTVTRWVIGGSLLLLMGSVGLLAYARMKK